MGWRWLQLLALVASGCYHAGELCQGTACGLTDGNPTDGDLPDVNPDLCVGTPPNQICYPEGEVPTIAMSLDLPIDTANCPGRVVELDGQQVCVIEFGLINVASTIRISGPLPVMLVGFQQITIGGVIDVSGAAVDDHAAGSNLDAICNESLKGAGDSDGGAGGSFAAIGGAGGVGNISVGIPGEPAAAPFKFRGGCDGAGTRGGRAGGHGGGAIYLASHGMISITGLVTAAGGGGAGGVDGAGVDDGGGGAGGGSGGYIAIDAPNVSIASGGSIAVVLATGGGGGGGGTTSEGGGDGESPSRSDPVGTGGNGGTNAGRGGDGGTNLAASPGGSSAATGAGGGGGGGGAGTIQLFRGAGCAASACLPTPEFP